MNKGHLNSLRFLINEYKYSSKKFKTVTYFRQSMHSYLLWIHILESHYSNKFRTSENLLNSLKKYASRKTILTILNDAVKSGFLEKQKSQLDRRVSNYKPTILTINEYEEWNKTLKENI